MYDFETVHIRNTTGWVKWDHARQEGCPHDITPLTTADMEFTTAPEVIEAVRQTAEGGLWGYTEADADFRGAVTDWMAHRHGWRAEPDWVVGTAGVVPAIYSAVQALTKPGDGVLIQPPVYPPFFSAALDNKRTVVESPLVCEDGNYRIDFDDLRAKAKQARLMVLCSPHNPVGRVWTREELAQIADICLENELTLFADEIHCDLIPSDAKFASVGGLEGPIRDRCLIGTSASKTFSLAGLGCSAIIVPGKALRQQFTDQLDSEGFFFNTTFGIAATKAAYRRGEAWLDALLAQLRDNFEWLAGFLAESLPMVQASPMQGTYLAWLDLGALGLDDDALTAFLHKEAQVYANAGTMFGTGGSRHIRVNIACPLAVLQQAMQRLAQAARARGLV